MERFLLNKWVGISISESQNIEEEGFGVSHLRDAMATMAQQLLHKGANIAYGGDITINSEFNFLKLLLEVAQTYRLDDLMTKDRIKNYAAGPVRKLMSPSEEIQLKSQITLVKTKPEFGYELKEITLGDENSKRIWARELTAMRHQMNEDLDARIVMGGKMAGFKGMYPGILEEAALALQTKKPLYVIGMFGGAAREVIEYLYGKKGEYSRLFSKFSINKVNHGLTAHESEVVQSSENLLDVVRLILKGLKTSLKN